MKDLLTPKIAACGCVAYYIGCRPTKISIIALFGKKVFATRYQINFLSDAQTLNESKAYLCIELSAKFFFYLQ